MGIAALDSTNRKAEFSNYGADVSLSAPGVSLISLYPELNEVPDYALWSGTSFAAPLTTASVALILENNLRRNARSVLENTAAGIDDSNPGLVGKLGKGRIDPLRALQSFDAASGNHSEIALQPTGVEPAAMGKAEVSVMQAEQEFEIEAEQLQPRATYKVVVDGNVVVDGTNPADPNRQRARASNFGAFKIEFSTAPSGDHLALPPALTPVTAIRRVEVRDSLDRVVLANTFVPTPGMGGGMQSVEKEAVLNPTGPIPQATGKARAQVEPEREKLRVEAEGLGSGIAYEIFADTVSLGTVVAQSGYLGIEFTSDGSSGHLLPPAARPVTSIQAIEIRTLAGQAVLRGIFQAGGDDFGGGMGGGGETTFQGVIESLPPSGLIGDWRVAGRTVHVSQSTEIRQDKGPAIVGARVEVRGTTQPDGSTMATRVEVLSGGGGVDETSFQGQIQSMPPSGFAGNWVVGGLTVHVFSSTAVLQDKGPAVVGAQVEVRGVRQPDGSYNGNRIEVLSPGGGGQEVTRQATLNPTSIAPDAKGKVTTKMSSARQTLEIEGSKLASSANYEIFADGFSLGLVTTDGSGSFKVLLSSEDDSLPQQIRPVSGIQQITVVDSLSRTVLTGGPPS
jgi:hypothetical protein